MAKPIKLSNTLSVDYVGNVKLFLDSTSFVLSDEDVQALIEWYVQGMCPICFDEIPQDDVICDRCFGRAKAARA
jgi:hypothetical protein